MEKYDICIIGAGPSGYAAAMRAIDFGKKIVLIENKDIGGAGVKNGALSSKTWWEISREIRIFHKHLRKNNINLPKVDFNKVQDDVRFAIQTRIDILNKHIDEINKQMGQLFILKHGTAKLISPHEIQIDGPHGTEIVYAEYIILATGSSPRLLPNIAVDEKIVLTSDGIEHLDTFPESMVIIGAGVIGCEFATIFSGFGDTKVNIIDKGSRILPVEDEDVVNVIEEMMEKKGVRIHRNSKLVRLDVVDGKVEYELAYNDGRRGIFNVEKALLSVGRIPNLKGLGLDEVGIKYDSAGIINREGQTNIPNIYAIGDLTADIALVNVGELEGRHTVEMIYGKPERDLVYENISTIMFLDPEVAGVGMNEIEAQKKKIDYCVASLDYEYIPRAITQGDTRGFIKLLVTNDEEKRILGMRIVGREASSAIQAVALLIFMKKGIRELAECVHPHPSITEGVQECVRLLLGKSIFKSWAVAKKLYCKTYKNGIYETYHL